MKNEKQTRQFVLSPRMELLSILVLGSLPFLRALGRGLVSEDYIILRRLWEQPFWPLAWEQIKGPWMGATLVLFWRPLSTFILQIQELLWGVQPLGYLIVLLATHLANTALLFILTRKLFPDEKWPARAVCLFFAIYPLHPNSVLFVASFATVYATTFSLASLVLFVEGRRRQSQLLFAGSIVLFSLSLACYEGAFILPLILVSVDLLGLKEQGLPLDIKALIRRHIGFVALAAGYLLLRNLLLGVTLGGYSGSSFQLSSVWELLARSQPRWSVFLVPVFSWLRPHWLELLTRVVLMTSLAALILKTDARSGRMLFGLLWIMSARLPFGSTVVVPANGRYWYLASAGIGFLAIGLAEFFRRPKVREGFLAVLTVAVTIFYGICLYGYAQEHVAASELATKICSAGSSLVNPEHPESAIFLVGVPGFIKDPRRHNIAQVFAWGLSDALSLPFSNPAIRAFPLQSVGIEKIRPLMSREDLGSVWRWTGKTFRKVRIKPGSFSSIEIRDIDNTSRELQFRALDNANYTAFFLGRLNLIERRVPPGTGWRKMPLPVSYIQSAWHLYHDEVYVWVEASNSSGQVISSSRILSLPPP